MQIIIPHTNTDLDAMGAAIGAQVLYPQATIVLPGSASPLAGEFISLHRYNIQIRHPRDIDLGMVRRAIVVDTSDPARLGSMQEVVRRVEVHLYDHHPSEPEDLQGHLEVRDLVGATSTLMAELIEESGAGLTPVQATALLLGIYADTGSLTLVGTTDRDARAAAFLLSRGANLRALDRFLQIALSPAQQSLMYQLQHRSRRVTVNGARILLLEGETREYVGGLSLVVHRLQEILPAPALFAAVKMADRVHLVGRSEVPWVDAARVMAPFGGGGHVGAASAVARGLTLAEVVQRLEAVLDSAVERPVMARDVMKSPVKTIQSEKPIREAERLMLRHGHSGLPVVDDQAQLEGMVSLRDVAKARRHGLEHAPVKGIMIRRVLTVGPEDPLDQVQEQMVERDIGRVPVVEGGNLVGIISRSDLLGLLYGPRAPRWHRTLYAGPGNLPPEVEQNQVFALARQAVDSAPEGVRALLRRAGHVADQLGVSVYAVGGLVRDLLLERPILDTDLVVEGDGPAFARVLAADLGGYITEVPRFQTAHIHLDAAEGLPDRVDVATARREFYEHAAALPLVEHADLREDLYRRDFSINAMAIQLGSAGTGGLIDIFGGLGDLKDRQIRILHSLSFVEDPTRILRAVRFAHRYGFELESETYQCAKRAVEDGFLERVSADRLRQELVLLLSEPRAGVPLRRLQEVHVLQRVLPDVAVTEAIAGRIDRIDALATTVPELFSAATPWITKLMLLLEPAGVPAAERTLYRLKLRKEEIGAVLQLYSVKEKALIHLTASDPDPSEVVRLLRDCSPSGLLMLCALGATKPVNRYWNHWRQVRLAISGKDLVHSGVAPGPAIGRALERVLAARLKGNVPDRQSQLSMALRYAHEEA